MHLKMAEGVVRRSEPPLKGARYDPMQTVEQEAARGTHAAHHCQDNGLRLSSCHLCLTLFPLESGERSEAGSPRRGEEQVNNDHSRPDPIPPGRVSRVERFGAQM